jgi:hypothetical protein
MTAADWITATDPQEMLAFLDNSGRGSERKLRLFAVACCRRIWHWMPDKRSRDAATIAEKFAEGCVGRNVLMAAHRAISRRILKRRPEDEWTRIAGNAASRVVTEDSAIDAARRTAADVQQAPPWSGCSRREEADVVRMDWWDAYDIAREAERGVQASLLRCVFGNPFGLPSAPTGSVLAWDDGTIPMLAEGAYEHRSMPSGELDKERLAVLADALEEVGADALLLGHLRRPGPHVRGDWVIDMLTGRE